MLFTLLACSLPAAWGQTRGYRPAPNYITGAKADQAEGAEILSGFRRAGISGTYWLSFELRVMPRHGAETKITGQMFGTRTEAGPLTRLTIDAQRWLIQGGRQPAAWLAKDGALTQELAAAQTLEPLAQTDLTLFDLQMPFYYWTDFIYEGLSRIRGRPAHSFVVYPPADLAAAQPGLTGVRMLIDTQFQALVQAEQLGAKGAVEKTISILDLKKVGDTWIPKSIDFRNNLTRGKTRFTVTAAALDLVLAPEVFSSEGLKSPQPVVPADKIETL